MVRGGYWGSSSLLTPCCRCGVHLLLLLIGELLRHVQDPQTHCAPHLGSQSKWGMLSVGCLKLWLIPLTQNSGGRAGLGCLSEMGVLSPCCREGPPWDWHLVSLPVKNVLFQAVLYGIMAAGLC